MSDELIAAAELGDESKRFLESDLGKCLLGMAQQEVAAAQEKLETVSAYNPTEIIRLQNQARFGRQFEQWLRELLQNGEQAMQVFKQQRDT